MGAEQSQPLSLCLMLVNTGLVSLHSRQPVLLLHHSLPPLGMSGEGCLSFCKAGVCVEEKTADRDEGRDPKVKVTSGETFPPKFHHHHYQPPRMISSRTHFSFSSASSFFSCCCPTSQPFVCCACKVATGKGMYARQKRCFEAGGRGKRENISPNDPSIQSSSIYTHSSLPSPLPGVFLSPIHASSSLL